jgi:hypothetical protein
MWNTADVKVNQLLSDRDLRWSAVNPSEQTDTIYLFKVGGQKISIMAKTKLKSLVTVLTVDPHSFTVGLTKALKKPQPSANATFVLCCVVL